MEQDPTAAARLADPRAEGPPRSLFEPYDRRGRSRVPDPEFRQREGTRAWLVEWGAILSPWAGVLAFLGSCGMLAASKSGNQVLFAGDRLGAVEAGYRRADSVINLRVDSLSAKVDKANSGIERLITITCAQRQPTVAAVVEKCYPSPPNGRGTP